MGELPMRIKKTGLIAVLLLSLLLICISAAAACASPSSASNQTAQSQPEITPPDNAETSTAPPQTPATTEEPGRPAAATPVSVVVAGYINHGPMQPTVRAIKEVLSKYDGSVDVTWVDLATSQGQSYFQEHSLTAHMNVIINGTYEYEVNGKTVDFQWFEGQQWTEEELDTVLAGLIHS
jgi:hypothetical protein